MSNYFFFDFQRKGGFISAAVEIYANNGDIVQRTRVEMPAADFYSDCDEAGIVELAGTDLPDGLCEYAWDNTDDVFQALHANNRFTNLENA
jgi:hypothetical protein